MEWGTRRTKRSCSLGRTYTIRLRQLWVWPSSRIARLVVHATCSQWKHKFRMPCCDALCQVAQSNPTQLSRSVCWTANRYDRPDQQHVGRRDAVPSLQAVRPARALPRQRGPPDHAQERGSCFSSSLHFDTAEILFLSCAHLDFQSAITLHNDELEGSFHRSYSRLLNVKTSSRNSIRSLDTFRCVPEFTCRKISYAQETWSLHSRWNFISTLTEWHVYGGERWPTEVTSNTYSAVSAIASPEILKGFGLRVFPRNYYQRGGGREGKLTSRQPRSR